MQTLSFEDADALREHLREKAVYDDFVAAKIAVKHH